jgi:hypothetical protein
MQKYTNKQWACANGDWITMVGECNWELVNVYTHHKIPLPVLPFVGTWWLDTFMYNEHLMVLKKIAICKVTTAAGRYQDFSFLPLSPTTVLPLLMVMVINGELFRPSRCAIALTAMQLSTTELFLQ